MIGFVDAVKMFFRRYVDFQGRSSRAEYWWVILFQIIASILKWRGTRRRHFIKFFANRAFFSGHNNSQYRTFCQTPSRY